MINRIKDKEKTDTWSMCKEQQNTVFTDGETNAQKKKKKETM